MELIECNGCGELVCSTAALADEMRIFTAHTLRLVITSSLQNTSHWYLPSAFMGGDCKNSVAGIFHRIVSPSFLYLGLLDLRKNLIRGILLHLSTLLRRPSQSVTR